MLVIEFVTEMVVQELINTVITAGPRKKLVMFSAMRCRS
jgi:hypothetical protein